MARIKTLLALLFGITLTAPLMGLPIKVVSIDHKAGRIKVLLPVHHTTFEATLAPEEPEIRVRLNEFYDAEIVSGEVNTTRPNMLRIRIPDQKPVKFRLRKISFLDP